MVRSILEELPEKDRRILRAIFLEDADKCDVCQRFDVNRDYLRVLVHRAKIRFREALDKGGREKREICPSYETAGRLKTQY